MYREEYPRPSFVRKKWQNLNGVWQVEICENDKGDEYYLNNELKDKIELPFCLESKLGGLAHTDFINLAWYKKTVRLTKEDLSGRVKINFGAVDYSATLYINGLRVGCHKGGYIAFGFDITEFLAVGENTFALKVSDTQKTLNIPYGKQSATKESRGCSYTRTTGIWQTVWLEFLPSVYIKERKITPSVDEKSLTYEFELNKIACGKAIVKLLFDNKMVGLSMVKFNGDKVSGTIDNITDIRLWDTKNPNLYDLNIKIIVGEEVDEVSSYVGFRKIELKDKKLFLNDKPIFLRMVLDQGFYPDGIYTAPTKEDIERDIDISLAYGFNGARPHQKVFEEYYLYYADKKGYLIWSEFPNWGIQFESVNKVAVDNFISEWKEVVKRDYNHPSIIGYCPLNEVWDYKSSSSCDGKTQKILYDTTKEYDSKRPFIGASGGNHYITDIDDFHDYTHDRVRLVKAIENHSNGRTKPFMKLRDCIYKAKKLTPAELKRLPTFVSEYGGIGYLQESDNGWGYNGIYKTEESFLNTYIALTTAILESDAIGFCYTQLTDVEQEQNGLVKYSRKEKLSEEGKRKIRECNQTTAKCER